MKKSSIKKLVQLHRQIKDYDYDRTSAQMAIEEVLIAECGEDELEEATNTSVTYK